MHRHCVSLLKVRNTNTATATLAQFKLYSLSQQHINYHHYHQTQRRCKNTLSSSAIKETSNINPKLVSIINHDINYNEKNKSHNSSHRVNLENLSSIPLSDVRNFCIVAHVDHGKSSLASRMLERTGNLGREEQLLAIDASTKAGSEAGINKSDTADIAVSIPESATSITNKKEQIQHLDTLAVEQERGITVKSTAASMLYHSPVTNRTHLLNMVDTPGHADFGLEVTRSLSSVQGAILLLDSSQGIQAQTLSVYDKSQANGVTLIPALTKIDLENARPMEVALSVSDLFGFDPDEDVLWTSARSRIGIGELLDRVCRDVPPPMSPLLLCRTKHKKSRM